MNFNKLKKFAAAAAAALLSVTIMIGVSVSAAENKDVWKDAKAMAGASYSSKYIKWVKKYSEKKTSKTISYSKSKTKEFFDKYNTAREENKPLSYSLVDEDIIMSIAYSDSDFKSVSFGEDMTFAVYANTKELSVLDIESKEKASVPVNKEFFQEFQETAIDKAMMLDIIGFGRDYNKNGKYFKFKSNDKIYYYEKFENDIYNSDIGFLFNENGKLLALGTGSGAFCVSISYNIDDSDFKIPDGYKTVDYDDLDSDFFN